MGQLETEMEAFGLRAAIEALLKGDAVINDDRTEIRWEEPDCDLGMNKLVGISRSDDGYHWMPLIEVGANL